MNLNQKVNPELNCTKYIKSYDEKIFTSHLYNESIVRGNYANCLISILFNSNNLENTLFVINNFHKKTKNPKNIQFCIKIDNDDMDIKDKFIRELSKFNFNFIILASPKGRGFIDLWQWVNYLYKVSSKKSKFVMNISDEMYIKQKSWDSKLEKYIGAFEDEIFRLRTSVFKNRNYTDLYECGYAPDTTAIYSRKYLEIQGDFSPCFGPDNGQQFVAYYLSKLNLPRHYQFSRDLVSEGLDFHGQGTNIGLSKVQKRERNILNFLLWRNMYKYKYQNLYFQRARKIQIEIIKTKYKNLKVIEFGYKFHITFKENNEYKFLRLNNYISKSKLFIYKISKLNFIKNNTGYDSNIFKGYFLTLYISLFKKFPYEKDSDKNTNFFQKFEYLSVDSRALKLLNEDQGFARKLGFGLIPFIIFYIRLVILLSYFIIHHILYPRSLLTTLSVIYGRFFKLQRVNSNIFSNNESDQSKTFIVKGD